MPLPLLTLAVPVLHSSGAWIASTGAGGYLAGTLSSTWIGSFIAGNSGLLGSLGFVSAAGIFGSSGGLAAIGTSAATGLGSALTAIGLGGLATKLGLAPTLFLGLTPIGWTIVGSAATVAASGGYFIFRRQMKSINEERSKGGLEPITWKELIKEVRSHEFLAMGKILEELSLKSDYRIELIDDRKNVVINGRSYPVARLKYRVNKDESEEIIHASKIGLVKIVLLVKPAKDGVPEPA